MNSGVYTITNTKNGHRYVGSAVNLTKRWREHRHGLRNETHRNAYLQRAWNKYGEGAFKFETLEQWEPEFLVSMEQWWMNMLQPEYNIAPVAGSSLGVIRTKEYRAKKSVAMMGKKNALGHKCSDETKAKISAANKGNKYSVGHKQTDEHRAKLSAAKMGNKNAEGHEVTEEARARMSASHVGRPWSAARRAAQEAKCSS